MRCSHLPCGKGLRSGRGADAPSFLRSSWLLQPTVRSSFAGLAFARQEWFPLTFPRTSQPTITGDAAMADQWYYKQNNEQHGPVSTEQLKQLASRGQIQPTDLICKQGTDQWIPAGRVKGLLPASSSKLPSVQAVDESDTPPPVPRTRPKTPASPVADDSDTPPPVPRTRPTAPASSDDVLSEIAQASRTIQPTKRPGPKKKKSSLTGTMITTGVVGVAALLGLAFYMSQSGGKAPQKETTKDNLRKAQGTTEGGGQSNQSNTMQHAEGDIAAARRDEGAVKRVQPDQAALAGTSNPNFQGENVANGVVVTQFKLPPPGVVPLHEGPGPYSLAATPDGHLLVSSGNNDDIRLWSVADGKLMASWTGEYGLRPILAISRDGHTLLSCGEDAFPKFWSLLDGKNTLTIPRVLERVRCRAMNPDANIVAIGEGSDICLYGLQDGADLMVISAGPKSPPVSSLAISASGRLLASSHYNVLRLWSVQQGTLIKTLGKQNNFVYGVAFSPDEQLLASFSFDQLGDEIRVWTIPDGVLSSVFRLQRMSRGNITATFCGNRHIVGDVDGRKMAVISLSENKIVQFISNNSDERRSAGFQHSAPSPQSALGTPVLPEVEQPTMPSKASGAGSGPSDAPAPPQNFATPSPGFKVVWKGKANCFVEVRTKLTTADALLEIRAHNFNEAGKKGGPSVESALNQVTHQIVEHWRTSVPQYQGKAVRETIRSDQTSGTVITRTIKFTVGRG